MPPRGGVRPALAEQTVSLRSTAMSDELGFFEELIESICPNGLKISRQYHHSP